MDIWWPLTLNISQLQELVCFRTIITYTDSVLTSLDYLKYFKCPVPLGHPQLSGSILKEDFLGATVFTLAAASLQGETLLEREESLARRDAGNYVFHIRWLTITTCFLKFNVNSSKQGYAFLN